ncbi:V-type ATP synthase subunit C [Oceanirhabdus sp. W0125-5]|uniref:V-type ATP synthase subunit C n=1 Tax=Oceanirhabdus sp. W0125-5 TaxID=2999116 RepID=UPI0022F2D54A|nr:V-type ATP synthase subunit C [Oceanirhabdus sp. W0125-5]WBW96017.1 V-type ATP synthase subunit C [Oceanirhabdus sp. W0125-5]
MIDNTMFIQAVSHIRALELNLLDEGKLNRMIESSTGDEAMKILAETVYGQYISKLERTEDYESMLGEELKKVYKEMYKVSPDRRIIDIMGVRYDYHNIKTLLKAKFLNKDLDAILIPIGVYSIEQLKNALDNGDFYDIKGRIRTGIEESLSDYEKYSDPQRVDMIMDRYMYIDMYEMSKEIGDSFIEKYVKMSIDATNITTFFRIKKQKKEKVFLEFALLDNGYIDLDIYNEYYNDSAENFASRIAHTDYYDLVREGVEELSKSGKLSTLEMLRDNFIMNKMKDAKYVSFGSEPIIAYIFGKESELKAIRTIMVGKLNKIEPDLIKGRLRDIYV